MDRELKELKPKNLNQRIISVRKGLTESKLKKSGFNKYAGFGYYELGDFLPKLNQLMAEQGINDIFNIAENQAVLEIVYNDEKNVYKIPFYTELPPPKGMNEVQHLGALITYSKRYLYMNAFGIADGEVIDSTNPEANEENKKISAKIREFKNILAENKDFKKEFLSENNLKSNPTEEEITELTQKLKDFVAEKKLSDEDLIDRF